MYKILENNISKVDKYFILNFKNNNYKINKKLLN